MHCFCSVFLCVCLVITYVGSLYVWSNPFGRDHPSTIKKRFVSIMLVTIIWSVVVYFVVDFSYFEDCSFWLVTGIRSKGLFQAVVYPLILTLVLFSGPFSQHFVEGLYSHALDTKLWKPYVCNLKFFRDYVAAPFSEEFTFRACMLPILLPCFGVYSVLICPLLFGIAHLHHLRERLAQQMELKLAILESLYQLLFTTAFGAYSSYLFIRTGHFVSPFVAHAFCNHMGFPDLARLLTYNQPRKTILILIFIAGLASWILLLKKFTDPALFGNEVYAHIL